jgi:hypothetical protein
VVVMIGHQPFPLANVKDARTQTVVSPSDLASGTPVYPYAKAKRLI